MANGVTFSTGVPLRSSDRKLVSPASGAMSVTRVFTRSTDSRLVKPESGATSLTRVPRRLRICRLVKPVMRVVASKFFRPDKFSCRMNGRHVTGGDSPLRMKRAASASTSISRESRDFRLSTGIAESGSSSRTCGPLPPGGLILSCSIKVANANLISLGRSIISFSIGLVVSDINPLTRFTRSDLVEKSDAVALTRNAATILTPAIKRFVIAHLPRPGVRPEGDFAAGIWISPYPRQVTPYRAPGPAVIFPTTRTERPEAPKRHSPSRC